MKPRHYLGLPLSDQLTSEHGIVIFNPTTGLLGRASAAVVQAAPLRTLSVTLTADQNNWNPTGLSAADLIRVTPSITGNVVRLTGLQGGIDGRRLIIENVSTDHYLILSGEDSNSTAAYRFLATGRVPFVILSPGQRVEMTYDSTSARWRLHTEDIARIRYAEPINDLTTFLQTSVSGTAAAATRVPDATEGTVKLETGTTAAGRAGVGTKDLALYQVAGITPLVFRGAFYNQSAVSDGTNRYTLRAAFGDSLTTDPTDGLFLRGVDNVNSGKWQFCARGGGSETAVDVGLLASGGRYWEFAIVLAAGLATPRADLYMTNSDADGAGMAWRCSVTGANVPAAGEMFGCVYSIIKSLGTANRVAYGYPFTFY